jgi:tetratricopeptide (TPR) repeat protein
MAAAWHNLGLICAGENELPAAMTAFRQETRWEPENIQGWRELGSVLGKLGREDESVEALNRAKELEGATLKQAPANGAVSPGNHSKVALPPGLDLRLPGKGTGPL